MPPSSPFGRLAVYALLILGAVAFSFPFVWMISTSLKLDKELFRGQIDIVPQQPDPRPQSPFFDPRQYSLVDRSERQFAALAGVLTNRATAAVASLPDAANAAEAPEIIADGLYASLQRRSPASIWEGPTDALRAFAEAELPPERVNEVARHAFRELGIGSLRVRNNDLAESELAAATPPPQRWHNRTPAVASLRAATDSALPFAAVDYDFSHGDRFVLDQTFLLPFPTTEMQRLQLRLRPDDTWHDLAITVEAAGVKYSAERNVALSDVRWLTVTLQHPGPDDHSTKLKTWLILSPIARGSAYDHGPSGMKVTLEFRQLSLLRAGFSKARHNFQSVLDQIPFWRYVQVSVLLVILNIVLTLLSSSLVAYAFARLQWPGRDIAFLVMLGTMMIPGQVTMIPHFLIWKSVGAYNTLTPLFAGAALGNAFFIFLMRQFLKGIPPDLEDAARIDGCGFLRIYWHVMLPLVKPSLAAIAIFTFMGTWNDFLGPLVYLADQRLYPLAFGLYAFSVQVNSNPVLTMAASLLMTIPVIVVFFLTQRYFVQGITLTGMKG